MAASQIVGRQNVKATLAGVDGRIVAWRLRVVGKMRIDPAKTDGFAESRVIARRDWTAPNIGDLANEPFSEMDHYSEQIVARAKQVAASR
jgi:hypothetical protein